MTKHKKFKKKTKNAPTPDPQILHPTETEVLGGLCFGQCADRFGSRWALLTAHWAAMSGSGPVGSLEAADVFFFEKQTVFHGFMCFCSFLEIFGFQLFYWRHVFVWFFVFVSVLFLNDGFNLSLVWKLFVMIVL